MKKLIAKVIVGLAALFCLFPFAVTLLGSFLPKGMPLTLGRELFQSATLDQYEELLLRSPQYLMWFWNSVKIAVLTLLIAIPLSLMAAYGFSQFTFPGRDALFFLYIIVMLMPFQATLVPQYITLNSLNLLDTLQAVILPNGFSAFGAFLMTQFMRGIDREILDAAQVDGVSDVGSFFYIVVPMSRTAISALSVLLFIESWSMIEQPMIFLTDQAKLPLSLYLGNLSSSLLAGGVVFFVLPLLVYLLSYDDLVEGIGHSGIK